MENKRNILVTNYQDSGEDVMVVNTSLTVEELMKGLKNKKQYFDECYEVKEEELQYYVYDPLFADEDFDNNVKKN